MVGSASSSQLRGTLLDHKVSRSYTVKLSSPKQNPKRQHLPVMAQAFKDATCSLMSRDLKNGYCRSFGFPDTVRAHKKPNTRLH